MSPPRETWIALLALTSALASGCSADSIYEDPNLCGFDGDASPGYQQVRLVTEVVGAPGLGTPQAVRGSPVQVRARVFAGLLESSLCNTDVAWEVRSGGGTVAAPQSNTGLDEQDYVATNVWTLGPTEGVQSVYLYVKDDPTINTLLSVTATSGFGVNLLVDGSFDSTAVTLGLPTQARVWSGDLAQRAFGEQGIVPRSGGFMHKFIASGQVAGAGFFTSQEWQLVDVSAFAEDIDAGKVRLDASAWVNRVAGDAETDTRFDLRVLAFPGTPAGFPTDYPPPAGQIRSTTINTEPATWQQLQVQFDVLPAGTRYVAVEIYPYENVFDDAVLPEFDGHYADDVSLVLTELP